MPRFTITHPDGRSIKVEGDHAPSLAEAAEIFAREDRRAALVAPVQREAQERSDNPGLAAAERATAALKNDPEATGAGYLGATGPATAAAVAAVAPALMAAPEILPLLLRAKPIVAAAKGAGLTAGVGAGYDVGTGAISGKSPLEIGSTVLEKTPERLATGAAIGGAIGLVPAGLASALEGSAVGQALPKPLVRLFSYLRNRTEAERTLGTALANWLKPYTVTLKPRP